jgi:hypothetical protein
VTASKTSSPRFNSVLSAMTVFGRPLADKYAMIDLVLAQDLVLAPSELRYVHTALRIAGLTIAHSFYLAGCGIQVGDVNPLLGVHHSTECCQLPTTVV